MNNPMLTLILLAVVWLPCVMFTIRTIVLSFRRKEPLPSYPEVTMARPKPEGEPTAV
jgi:hypothetical protein